MRTQNVSEYMLVLALCLVAVVDDPRIYNTLVAVQFLVPRDAIHNSQN